MSFSHLLENRERFYGNDNNIAPVSWMPKHASNILNVEFPRGNEVDRRKVATCFLLLKDWVSVWMEGDVKPSIGKGEDHIMTVFTRLKLDQRDLFVAKPEGSG